MVTTSSAIRARTLFGGVHARPRRPVHAPAGPPAHAPVASREFTPKMRRLGGFGGLRVLRFLGTHPLRVPRPEAILPEAMPIYEYKCEQGHIFEVMQRITDDPVSACQTCEAPVQRVFHPVAVHFKGTGFYKIGRAH